MPWTRVIPHLVLAALCLSACGSDDGHGAGNAPALIIFERTYVDDSRNIPRTPTRALRTLFWVPEGARQRPLLILAHGFGGLPEKFDAFARTVAGAGYVVAAPAFPLTNEQAPGGHENGLSDFRNQPADLSFVTTRILDANEDPEDPLFAAIDPDRIAVLGHSLGGLTTLAATRKACCRDPRLKAAINVAPLVALFLSQFGPDPIVDGPPTLILHGQADPTVPFQSSVDLYDDVGEPKILVGLLETGHSDLLESQAQPSPPQRAAAEDATISFLDAIFTGETTNLETVLAGLAADGHYVERDFTAD